ncbi:MAG: NUDIX hydrolase, partial [Williamsia herbipolensis]|nr:NUDIX hydrolase [Williamsia herbipolensis]
DVEPFEQWVDDHGGWSYTTIVARGDGGIVVHPVNAESTAVCWWELDAVGRLPLHRGFAAAWPQLRDLIGESAS